MKRLWEFLAVQDADHPVYGPMFGWVHTWRYGAWRVR